MAHDISLTNKSIHPGPSAGRLFSAGWFPEAEASPLFSKTPTSYSEINSLKTHFKLLSTHKTPLKKFHCITKNTITA